MLHGYASPRLLLLRLGALTCVAALLGAFALPDQARAQDRLIISQYVDTDSGTEPKGVELWNVSGSTIDFSTDNLTINRYANGGPSASADFELSTGTLGPGEVMIVGGSTLESYRDNNAPSVDYYDASFFFNGNDALEVVLGGTTEDVFGTIGSDPGTAWTGSGVSTADQNIQLLGGISSGTTSGFTDPSTRFETAAADPSDLSGFGVAPDAGASGPTVEFSAGSQTVAEEAGSVSLTVQLNNPDGNAVDVDVAFDTGNSTASLGDIGNYTTETVSFPAGASDGATQPVAITITDDSEAEPREDAVFELTNLSTSGSATIGSVNPTTLTITDNDQPLVINEILADPASGIDGDANGDGTRDGSEDEFVEIYNDGSAAVDIGGYTLEDGAGLRHTFPANTVLDPGVAVVVFGGGTPTGIPGVVQVSSEGFLGLNNGGDDVTLKNASGQVVLAVSYGSEGGDNQSLTRDPDFTGSFTKHSQASGSGGALFSPGETVGGTALPVELVAFRAQETDGNVALTWKTASETNNAAFRVQRRAGKGAWTALETIEGAGTTTAAQRYRFTDREVPFDAETLTYRLKQVDTDGSTSLSETVTVKRGGASRLVLNAPSPNPVRTEAVTVELAVPAPMAKDARLSVYNVLGQRVASADRVRAGRQTVKLSVAGLASGTYFLRLSAGGSTTTQKITVVK